MAHSAVRYYTNQPATTLSLLDALLLITSVIAIAVALYTQFISIPYSEQGEPLKIDPEHFPEVLEYIKEWSKRLARVESSQQDIKQIIARIDGFEKRFKNLEAIAYKDGIANRVERKELEDRVRESEHNFLDQISARAEEVNVLKNEFLKFKDEVGVKVDGIWDIKKELLADVMTLEEKLGEQSQFVEKKTAAMAKQISQHNETLRCLNVSVGHLGSNFKHVTENVTRISIETLLKNEFLKFKDEVGVKVDGIWDIKQEQKELLADVMILEEKLGEQSQFVKKKTAEMAKQISQHNETLRCLNVSVGNLGSNFKHVTENITRILKEELNKQSEFSEKENAEVAKEMPQHNETLRGLKVSVGILTSNLKHVDENMTRISIEILVLNKKIDDIKENEFDKGSLIVAIMINTTLLVLVLTYLAANRDTDRHVNRNVDIEQQQANDGTNDNPAPYSTARGILNQVRTHPRLERKLCIISFYEETHPLHMRITQSVTQQLNLEPVELIIRRHEDILEIPPVSLYFKFVDFNEQNVIIEEPTLGLGDLRLTTVQAVQKMGGKIVIFYVRDPNSRQLDPTKLYNEDLVSVTRQRELSALNRLSRFISAYDQLTDFQKSHLRQIVVDTIIGH